MNTIALFLTIILLGLVSAQTEFAQDPGFESLSGDQCGNKPWNWRADFLWNTTDEFFDSRCAPFFELPTQAVPGLTKGNQTNINKNFIPSLPSVAGGNYPSSAVAVDMNTPCRFSLYQPIDIDGVIDGPLTLSLKLWVRSDDDIQQVLAPNSAIPDAELLQYLREPDGLLKIDESVFPPIKEETNQVRIDILLPDETGSFFTRAFSLNPDHIAGQIEIPGFDDGQVTPPFGTNEEWIDVEEDISDIVAGISRFAIRISSAQSLVGVSWGVSDVHLVGTVDKKRSEPTPRVQKRTSPVFPQQEREKTLIHPEVTYIPGKPLWKR